MENIPISYAYIRDYYHTLYSIYGDYYVGYPLTYYSIDWENSIYDEKLTAGTYEKIGVGDLSGMKWKKILHFPVYAVEQIQPEYNASEKGLVLETSEISSISFSSNFGLKPFEWDIIEFQQDFMFKDRDVNDQPLFHISNITLSMYGSLKHWKCKINVSPVSKVQLDQQVTSYWVFLQHTKKIHNNDTASLLIKLHKKLGLLKTNTNNLFHNSGFYLTNVA